MSADGTVRFWLYRLPMASAAVWLFLVRVRRPWRTIHRVWSMPSALHRSHRDTMRSGMVLGDVVEEVGDGLAHICGCIGPQRFHEGQDRLRVPKKLSRRFAHGRRGRAPSLARRRT